MIKKIVALLFVIFSLAGMASNAQGIFGTNYNAVMRKGILDYKKGKFDDAFLKYKNIYKYKQNDPIMNYNMGTILYKKGEFDTAAYFFDNALKYVKDPILKSKAYYNMGNAYMKQKKFDKATESYSNALKYNPADEDSRYNLAYSLRNQKQQQKKQPQKDKQNEQQEDDKKENKMDQQKGQELIKSLNNKEQDHNKKIRGQGGNTKSKDW